MNTQLFKVGCLLPRIMERGFLGRGRGASCTLFISVLSTICKRSEISDCGFVSVSLLFPCTNVCVRVCLCVSVCDINIDNQIG